MRIGAGVSEKEIYFVITAQTSWEGKLVFDPTRHKTILGLPVDYPRINQFPEWFTVDPQVRYSIKSSDSKLSDNYSGASLLNGIPLKLNAGERLIIEIE